MDRPASKRRRSVIPIQRDQTRVGVWDDEGGVFTQENPRWSAPQSQEPESKILY
jgi:hypothetical protein